MYKNICVLAALLMCQLVNANQYSESKIYDIHIESQQLSVAINKLSEITFLEIMFFSEITEGVVSSEVSGKYTASQAVDAMLVGTELQRVELTSPGAIGIKSLSEVSDDNHSNLVAVNQEVEQLASQEAVVTRTQVSSNVDTNTDNSAKEKVDLESISVTGSRIQATSIISPIPTLTIGRADIESAGTIDLGEIVEEMPGVYLGISPVSSLLSTQNAGLSTIDLRALGTNRTLTLINGRRVVSNSGSAQRVDTATIPSGFIDYIDITTGGASAIYGSDAIAGVANIVLKNDFVGFGFDVRHEDSHEGGRRATSAETIWGFDFNDGKGNFMIGASWEDKNPLLATDRDYALNNLEIDLETGEFEPNVSSTLPGGRFENGDAWNIDGVWQNDRSGSEYCLDDGRIPACDDYQGALDGWDFRPFNMIFPERERFSALVNSKYLLTDTLVASVMLQFSETDTKASRTPASGNDSHTFGPFDDQTRIGDISSDNPFIHPAVLETLSGSVDWRRRFVEVGFRDRSSNRKTSRFSLGLDGQFNYNWNWHGYIGQGVYKQHQEKHNEVNRQNIQFALDVEEDPAASGQYRCVNEEARANGCVPLNVFGVGSISPEAADYIRHTIILDQKLEQTSSSFVVEGDLMELPAGAVKTAFGIDYRKEQQFATGDPVTNAGLTSSSSVLDIDAEFDVKEAFVEFNVPLIEDKTWIKSFDMATAFRVANYSTIGNVSSWNFGLSYQPNESIRFRAQISQAQRAPDITELFSPQRSDFDSFNDPCDGVTADTAGIVAENCRSIAEIAAIIASEGEFVQDGSSIFGPSLGNPNLIEETADTFTYGLVFTPQFLEGFSLIADYYNIEVEDAISSVSSQLAGDLCYGSEDFGNNRFCSSITRGSDGEVSRIVNQEENLNSLISEGVDVTMAYDFELDGLPGRFNSKLIHSRIIRNETNFNGPDGEVIDDFAGEVGLPEKEYRFTLGWRNNDFKLQYKLKYVGSAVDDNNVAEEDIFGFVTFDSTVVHDIYASYTFDYKHRYRLFGGIKNITNEHGPYLPDGYNSGNNYNVGRSYDRVGRRFYIGMKFDW